MHSLAPQLLRRFIPLVVTVERPVARKGSLHKTIAKHLPDTAVTLEKDFFDLTKEQEIREHIATLGKKQAIVVGCETDVCVLQSVLGLIGRGYQVYVVEDLLFSSTNKVDSAVARMKAAGAILLTYKTLYYELLQAVGGPRDEELIEKYGLLPDDLPDQVK